MYKVKTTYNVILLAEILAYNKSALYRSASPAFSFVLTYSYWPFASEPAWWAKKGAGRGRGTTKNKSSPKFPLLVSLPHLPLVAPSTKEGYCQTCDGLNVLRFRL